MIAGRCYCRLVVVADLKAKIKLSETLTLTYLASFNYSDPCREIWIAEVEEFLQGEENDSVQEFLDSKEFINFCRNV